MKPIITAQHMRAAEQAVWDVDPHVDLMARAAAHVARVAVEVAEPGPVVVVVGPGNNGGDGLFAAAELAASRQVWLWKVTDKAHEAGLAAALEAGCREIDAVEAVESLATAGLVIDAFTGLGSRPGLPGDVALFAEACVAVPVLSVDLPSGLDTDSGSAHPSFAATTTVTFAARKPCHVLEPAASQCGEVVVADIGVPVPASDLRMLEEPDLAAWWPRPDASSDKYSRGVVLLDTGSAHYPGAALLGLTGALHAGAGMVRYAGPAPQHLVLGRFPSVVIGPGRCQSVVVGSGWGEPDAARMAAAAAHDVPVVVDADALQVLPDGPLRGWLLTPHAGELARLLGIGREEVEAEPLHAVREAARATGATVLLKGATQYVAEPDGSVTIAVPGPAWTGQAGSGDVLAGVCGALLAAGLPAWRAAALGASIQARTAAWHPGPYPPDTLAEQMPMVIAGLDVSEG